MFRYGEPPVLSLITGTRNRLESFRRLLDSVLDHTTVPFELVVSDASDKPLPEELRSYSVLQILDERPRLGCVEGYNRAFRHARGTWCLWLNDDCEVLPNYDVEAVRFMEAHPEIGIGALYYRDHHEDFRVSKGWGMVYPNFGIIRRSLGDTLGWFDDELIMYGNDNSLTFRVLLHGLGVGSIPAARIFHNTVQDKERLQNMQFIQRDNVVIHRKYGHLQSQMQEVYNRTRHLAEAEDVRCVNS